MASTNKTTNYQLSQFSPTDKPAWLGDYNQDMSKIDAGMHTNASDIDTVESTVSTLQNAVSGNTSSIETLQTSVGTNTSDIADLKTADTTLDGKILAAQNKADSADGKANTNASNIANLQIDVTDLQNDVSTHTTAITNNANNITSVSNNLNSFKNSMKLSNFTSTTELPITTTGITTNVKLSLAQSSDSEIFKFYGRFEVRNTQGSSKSFAKTAITGLSGYYGIKTTLKLSVPPEESFIVDCAGSLFNRANDGGELYIANVSAHNIAIDTEGYIWVYVDTSNTRSFGAYAVEWSIFNPCVLFNANFGDTPSEDE